MNRRTKSFLIIIVSTVVLFMISIVSWCDQTTIFIVRHAERAPGVDNPPLSSPPGVTRANDLRDRLLNERIGFIYTTDSLRTRQTAQPLADALQLKPIIYLKGTNPVQNPGLPHHDHKNILIVGHSETILDIFKAVGADPDIPSIEGNDFDNLLIATVHQYFFIKWTTCVESTYGAPSP